jgi:hypothetical protein
MNLTSVLTIGNSLADNATVYMEDLIAADGTADFVLGKANIGGCSLEKHWNLVEQCDLLPDVRPYDFCMTGRQPKTITLREALAMHAWDYVTLQQVSDHSWRKETFYPYITNLYGLIKELAPQAQPVIHQTWAYRCDATIFKDYGINQEEMFAGLRNAYAEAAKELSCPILPCGAAFQKAWTALRFVPDRTFNYDQPEPLKLPDQSKSPIVGYYWQTGNTRSGKAELHMDERHGNAKGCYLANAVWYEMFTGREISRNPFCPDGVSGEELSILQHAAHAAVVEYGGPLRKLKMLDDEC